MVGLTDERKKLNIVTMQKLVQQQRAKQYQQRGSNERVTMDKRKNGVATNLIDANNNINAINLIK